MRRLLATAAVVTMVGFGVSACGGEDESSPLPQASASPSASATPTAEPSWSADAKPERPADEQTDAGAQAFTEFAADTVLYVMATGDAPALTAISDPASCTECREWEDNRTNGLIKKLTIPGGPTTYTPLGKPRITDEVYYQVRLGMDIPRGTSVSKDDGSKIDNVKAAKDLPFKADIMWKDDQWQLLRYDMG